MKNFQEVITTLLDFWAQEGCIIHQPHDIETGAGTFNPATFLKVLGPEPYSCVYVEPSKRPQDGRYGDNPNRCQLFHQLQVIVKPSPLDIQQKYLDSLAAIGFKLDEHDIRFVHDDWESPTLGAWGLGWEVWIDGMEVTQFTYFQSVAGVALDPISVEITYGLERLSMLLQKKTNFFDMQYNQTLTYGDVFHRNEVEFSTYNFEQASTKMWLNHFQDFEAEAKKLVEKELPIPAYDFVIKASHAFNMLEARGAFSTTERMRNILRIRDLAKLVADQYVISRNAQGHPLLKYEEKLALPPEVPTVSSAFEPGAKEDFLLEIGSEQLPATYVPTGMQMLEQKLTKLLKEHKLAFDSLSTYGTPQRLAIHVKGLIGGVAEEKTTRKGPPVASAFDSSGQLSKAGEGFFKASQLTPVSLDEIRDGKVANITIETLKGTEYLFVTLSSSAISTMQILQKELPQLIEKLTFEKNMRWASLKTTYARPLKWIVALYGNQVIPFNIAHLTSSNLSFGHAQLCPQSIIVDHPNDYLEALKKAYVLADVKTRRQTILEQLSDIEQETKTKAVKQERVMKEVLYLAEWPQLTYMSFDERFLVAPKELLVSEMIEHQRYFPLEDEEGKLKNIFVITADNNVSDLIRENNQKVLSARLSDGVFLYEFDLKTKLEEFNNKLKNVTFQQELGSIYDKMIRVKKLALLLSEKLKVGDAAKIVRAATLCKADLASELTQEFPELQGIIGKHYALVQGEEKEVASAIAEHWLPNSENGPLPTSQTGSLLSLADKMDNLVAYFSVGLKPSSSSDPFALRRQTLGILKILVANQWSLNLETLFNEAYHFIHPDTSGEEITHEILTFFKNRTKTIFEEYHFDKEVIEAALVNRFVDPYDAFKKVQALQSFKNTEEFKPLLEVYKRAKGQIEKQVKMTLTEEYLSAASEMELYATLQKLKEHFQSAYDASDYQTCFKLLATLQKPLAALFDEVKIMSDDENERINRIALLQEVFDYFNQMLDFRVIL